MDVQATTSSPLQTSADTIVVGAFESSGMTQDLPGEPLRALLQSGEARAEFRRLAVTHAEERRVIVVGLGARERFDSERARVAAATVHGRVRELGTETLCWWLPAGADETIAAGVVEGTVLHAYRFDRYKRADRTNSADRADRLERLIVTSEQDLAEPVTRAAIVVAAQNRARDLGNTPANDLTPAELAVYAGELARRLPLLKVSVLDGAGIRNEGMGAFAAVAQGSDADARLIAISYDGGAAPLLGLIGKAVTFDSGGLSLKSPNSMHEMKFDMAGGAAVLEAIAALAELQAPVRVLGVIGATENLPSGGAIRPGDIVRALDETTIEINNTDAEGRLVLADCITYARRQGAERLIDVATLTGGIVVALGSIHAGLFSNDDALAAQLEAAGRRTGELVWRQPLHPEYARMVEGRYARLTNRPDRRGEASAIAGAEFLHHFAGEVPWAHLDIAGTGWDVPLPYFVGKGATGYGVRLLVDAAQTLARA